MKNGLRRAIENDYPPESIPDRLLAAVINSPLVDEQLIPETRPRIGTLSDREKQIVLAASHGLTNDETAVSLGIARSTVLSHWKRINMKLAAKSRTHAVGIALREKKIL